MIQAAALRIATGAYKSTANIDVQIECCVPSLKLRREELSRSMTCTIFQFMIPGETEPRVKFHL